MKKTTYAIIAFFLTFLVGEAALIAYMNRDGVPYSQAFPELYADDNSDFNEGDVIIEAETTPQPTEPVFVEVPHGTQYTISSGENGDTLIITSPSQIIVY